MSRSLIYISFCLLTLTGFISGCGHSKYMNERLTLWRNDKIPYGAYYAHENLRGIFPDATIDESKKSPDQYASYDYESGSSDKHKLCYLIISTRVLPDEQEREALFGLVSQGAHVFISSFTVGQTLLDSLGLKVSLYNASYNAHDSLTVSVVHPETSLEKTYTYPGKALDNYFSVVDSSITTVLGKDAEGRANFVRISYEGGGAFYIHLAPTALTNFFLLHKENKQYYDEVLSWLPKKAEHVRWDDYFRNSVNGSGNGKGGSGNKGEKDGFSALSWLFNQPSLSWFWWLMIILLLLIYLFESKRKQRIIPVIKPLNNASLDFVKTIGRLYFQRKDNRDLAHKMVVHFLSYVRTRYNIRSSEMNEDFINKLAHKSGYDLQAVQALVYELKYSQDSPEYSDYALLELNYRLDQFYNYNT